MNFTFLLRKPIFRGNYLEAKMKILIALLLLPGLLMLQGNLSAAEKDSYQLRSPVSVTISVEPGWQQDGLIPVQFEMDGLELTFWMTDTGLVYEEQADVSQKDHEDPTMRHALFLIDMGNGNLRSGNRSIDGRVYERNLLRTRIRYDNILAGIQIDIEKNKALLNVNSVVIPVRLHAGQEQSGTREMQIGQQSVPRHSSLILSESRGLLFLKGIYSGEELEGPEVAPWAVKTLNEE
jgi:hypothetical protein